MLRVEKEEVLVLINHRDTYLSAEFAKLANIHLVLPPCSPDLTGALKRYHQEFLEVLYHLTHLMTKSLIHFF